MYAQIISGAVNTQGFEWKFCFLFFYAPCNINVH